MNIENLPDSFDVSKTYEKRKDSETCNLCDASFTKKMQLFGRNPKRHCKRCARCVCDVCSENKRQLSKNNHKTFRVCDRCDFEMDNFKLIKDLENVEKTSLDKIEILDSHKMQLVENKDQLEQNQTAASSNLQDRLQEKYDQGDTLKCKLNKYNKAVQAQINAKNSLHQSICDLEKVVGDFDVEQRRLKTMQSTLLTQTIELETELLQRNLLTEEQI